MSYMSKFCVFIKVCQFSPDNFSSEDINLASKMIFCNIGSMFYKSWFCHFWIGGGEATHLFFI